LLKTFRLTLIGSKRQDEGKQLSVLIFNYMRYVWKVTGLYMLHEKLLSQRKKHCFLWCCNVLWFQKPNFSILWQLRSFLHVFLSRHFLC